MRVLLSILLSAYTAWAAAADVIYPQGCKVLSSVGKDLRFAAKAEPKQSLYLIHNISTHEVWLTHPVKNPSASAGWTSQLNAGQWSALTTESSAFNLSCVEVKPGSEQYVDCLDVVTACDYANPTFSKSSKGAYWVAENKALAALLPAIIQRGIELPNN